MVPASFDRGLLRDLHPVRELEADGALPAVLDGVEHVDRQARLVEHVGPADALDLEGRHLQRPGADGEVPLLPQDAVHVLHRIRGRRRRLDREDVVVLVLEVTGLVGAQAGEGLGHR
jgi:hypothetical protein